MFKELKIAKSLSEAAKLAENEGFVFLSGGTEANRLNSPVSAKKAVSIQKLPLKDIERFSKVVDGKDHEMLRIGSACSFSQCLENEDVPEGLKEALKFNSSLQKRNMATIGGNLAVARDDSYLIPALIALNAQVEIFRKRSAVPVMEYLEKAAASDLVTAICVPLCERKVFSYRISNTAASHAIVTAAIGCCGEKGKIRNASAAAAIKGYGIVRMLAVEDEISASGGIDPERLGEVVMKVPMRIRDDKVYGSGAFRKYELSAAVRLIAERLHDVM